VAAVRTPTVAAPMLAQYIGETTARCSSSRCWQSGIASSGAHRLDRLSDKSLVHPREVFKPAILAGSAAIIAAHNNPSGDPEPSAEDTALTRRIASAGAILGIELPEHLILGEAGRFVSLRERGVL
jgi:DNA repair protein RadC